jgi:cytochrome c oxidase subunit 2
VILGTSAVPRPLRDRLRRAGSRLALTAVVFLGGCAGDGAGSSLAGKSDFARSILSVYAIITWASVGIATVVIAGVVWVLVRYRERPGAPPPRQVRGHTLLEISWTIAPALILLAIAIPTIQVVFRTQAPAPANALEVVVLGHQWWWEFRYPSLGITTANELHVPAGRAVTLRLEGPDVIHSFWAAPLAGKRDVVPGRVNHLTFTPDTPGEYDGQCAEFCGTSHANMRMRVFVDTPQAFERWAAGQKAAPAEAAGDAAEGKNVFTRNACVGCHTIQGVSSGVVGPDLSHFGSRTTFGAGMYPMKPELVAAWVRDPHEMKPGVKMPALGLSEQDGRLLAAYLLSLK